MSNLFSDFIKVVSRVPRKCLVLPFLLAVIICLSTAAGAAEKLIVGDEKVAKDFHQLHERGEIAKEFHIYVTDGYIEMADGEYIYQWGFTHAPDWADVGEISTVEERDAKLLPISVPGDVMRFHS